MLDQDPMQVGLAHQEEQVLKAKRKVLKANLKANQDTQLLKLWQNLQQRPGLKANLRVLNSNEVDQEIQVLKSSLKLKIHQDQEEDRQLKLN